MVNPDFDPVAEAERIISEGNSEDIIRKIVLDSKSVFHLARNLEMLLSISHTNEEATRAGLTSSEGLLQICLKKFQEQGLDDLSKETAEIDLSGREISHVGYSVAFTLQHIPLFYGADQLLARAFIALNDAFVEAGGSNSPLKLSLEEHYGQGAEG